MTSEEGICLFNNLARLASEASQRPTQQLPAMKVEKGTFKVEIDG